MEITLLAAAFTIVTGSENTRLTVKARDLSLTFSDTALSGITGTGEVKINICIVDSAKLAEAQKKLIGNRPVYELSVTIGGSAVTEFAGKVAVNLPYKPATSR